MNIIYNIISIIISSPQPCVLCVQVGALRRMLSLKQQLEEKVVAVEILGRQLVANNRSVVAEGSATPPVGVVSSVQLDPDTVDRAITGLLKLILHLSFNPLSIFVFYPIILFSLIKKKLFVV